MLLVVVYPPLIEDTPTGRVAQNGGLLRTGRLDLNHLHSDGFKKNFLCALILLRHEQAVSLVHESLGVVPVVPDGHVCVRVSTLEFAWLRNIWPNSTSRRQSLSEKSLIIRATPTVSSLIQARCDVY